MQSEEVTVSKVLRNQIDLEFQKTKRGQGGVTQVALLGRPTRSRRLL